MTENFAVRNLKWSKLTKPIPYSFQVPCFNKDIFDIRTLESDKG